MEVVLLLVLHQIKGTYTAYSGTAPQRNHESAYLPW